MRRGAEGWLVGPARQTRSVGFDRGRREARCWRGEAGVGPEGLAGRRDWLESKVGTVSSSLLGRGEKEG